MKDMKNKMTTKIPSHKPKGHLTTEQLYGRISQSYPTIRLAVQCAAELLQTPVDNLERFIPDELSFMDNPKLRDRAIKRVGITPFDPPVLRHCLHGPRHDLGGIILFECRTNPLLRYVYALYSVNGNNQWSFIAKKGEVWKIVRHFQRQHKAIYVSYKMPVLEEGLIEEIEKHSIRFLSNPQEIERYGVKVKRGILLHGPPGNGKSMVCKWIRRKCSQHSIDQRIVSGSEILDAFGNNKLSQLMSQSGVTFFDDIDIELLTRKNSGKATIACELLAAMDGMSGDGHAIRIFTTNEELSNIDPAFTRPGRIDRCFLLKKPFDLIRDGEYAAMYSGNKTLQSFLIENRGQCCEQCSLSKWQNKDIPLNVHHKDGDATNNLPKNLELLCLNCHGLTDNFGGRNKNSTRSYRYKK